ncbi:amidase [Pseudonocardia sp.]|uniref:amidase n=1 Tax=Pseudonocardia sp. TaxID=60912 RepID=UPI003D0AC34D
MTGVAQQVAALDATAQAALVAAGEVSAVELTEGAIERIERLNPLLGAVVTPLYDRAVAAAAQATGPFAGVPFLLKDLVAEIEGTPFAEGSAYVHGTVSTFTSELVRRLERAGLVILGRTASPEFGMVPACEPVLHGPTRNPWDPDRSTSGSSGGSAAAVASGMVPMAHGNDLGGSLRFPASACGLFGLKPTRARVPLGPEYGDAISGWAVEHALTVSVRDSAALLDATAGPMPGDPYPAPPRTRPFAAEVGADPGGLRIAWTARTPGGGIGHPDCLAALADAVALLTDLGHELVEADLPGVDDVGRPIGTVFDAATAWIIGYWTRRLGRPPRPGELEPVTRAYLDAGVRITAADYLLAIEELQRFARGVARFLSPTPSGFDGWLTPTMSEPPPRIGEMTSTPDDPLRPVHRGGRTVAYPAVVANITGNPAMSVPLWWNSDGLPIGVHLLGRFGGEATLLRLAAQLEAARPWTGRRPAVSGCGAPATP